MPPSSSAAVTPQRRSQSTSAASQPSTQLQAFISENARLATLVSTQHVQLINAEEIVAILFDTNPEDHQIPVPPYTRESSV